MKSTEQIRKEAISIFGPSKAGEALLSLEFFMESCGKQDIDDALPCWLGDDYEDYAREAMMAMQEAGLVDEHLYREQLDTWKASMANKVASGAAVIERIGYDPVNLGTAFHNEKLYYPVQTLVRSKSYTQGGEKRQTERVDIVVLRSDRTLLNVQESFDEYGKASGIYRLTDGTLLQKRPVASPHASWSWSSIQNYLHSTYPTKSLNVLAARIHRHLRSRVWLPDQDDYWLLTCAVITSYTQAIFDAVPLILLNGTPGTGKSELGAAMTEVSCNAVMLGKTTPPTMLRLMDEARGLIVIDDLESIGAKGGAGGKEKFSEMVQVLKMSYKKSSATKLVTNTKRRTEIMNFFGVKIVSNTSGVDSILGSRMLHINTGNIPNHEVDDFLARQGLSSDELASLRNELHIWAFDNVKIVHDLYLDIVSSSAERETEITAPLRVLAQLTDIEDAVDALNRAINKQSGRKNIHSSPEEALKVVMDRFVKEGAQVISISEVSLQLRKVLGKAATSRQRLSWMKPEWISKKIRSLGYVGENKGRKNLFGFQMRILAISREKRMELQAFSMPDRNPLAFCGGCSTCQYKSLGCEILPYRVEREGLL